jgi:hypothetical protein
LLVEFSEIFEKHTQKSFFEKRTQSYQTLKTYFDQKKGSVICYTTATQLLTEAPVVWYKSCNFCWLHLVKFLKNAPKSTFLKNAHKVTKL